MAIHVEVSVQHNRGTAEMEVFVELADPLRSGIQIPLEGLADCLSELAASPPDSPAGLHPVDDPARPFGPMDNSVVLRLVIELTQDPGGNTSVNLRRLDRSVDYGPLSVYDLPDVIQALAAAPPAASSSSS